MKNNIELEKRNRNKNLKQFNIESGLTRMLSATLNLHYFIYSSDEGKVFTFICAWSWHKTDSTKRVLLSYLATVPLVFGLRIPKCKGVCFVVKNRRINHQEGGTLIGICSLVQDRGQNLQGIYYCILIPDNSGVCTFGHTASLCRY